jgi:hypothetical protein
MTDAPWNNRDLWDRQRIVSATAIVCLVAGVALAYAFRAVLPSPLGWPMWQLLLPLTAVPILHRAASKRHADAARTK